MRPDGGVVVGDRKGIFLISLNRRAAQSLFESRVTVKADAANKVFEINTSGIVFAVVDGGIDASHPAFLKLKDKDEENVGKSSRVTATYDFTILRDIIARAEDLRDIKTKPDNSALAKLSKRIKDVAEQNNTAFEHLAIRNANQRDLDWEIVSPLLRISHEKLFEESVGERKKSRKKVEVEKEADASAYVVPETDHGTHVAGILAANLEKDEDFDRPIIGMCPQLSLYDLRVFDEQGRVATSSRSCAPSSSSAG